MFIYDMCEIHDCLDKLIKCLNIRGDIGPDSDSIKLGYSTPDALYIVEIKKDKSCLFKKKSKYYQDEDQLIINFK